MIDTYLQNSEVLERANFFNDFLRNLGWIILNFIKIIVNLCEELLNGTIKILDLTVYDTLEKIIPKSQLNILLTVICACCILYIGYTFILVGKKENTILLNVVIAIMILTGMPLFLNTLNNFTKSSIDYINISKGNAANEIIKNNITDLLFMDNNNFTSKGNNINVQNIDLISPNEVINPDERPEIKNKDIFLNEVLIDVNGFSYIKPIKTNILGFIDTTGYYYRYSIQFIPILISFLATCIAFCCTAFKIVKIVFEIVVSQILATLYAPADLYNGQKMKKIMTYLLSCYLVLIFAVMSLKIYIIFQEWITININNTLLSSIIVLFLAVPLIDGANIIERIIGIDAGLSSAFKTFASWYGLSKLGVRTTSKVLDTATNIGAFSVGAVNGAMDEYKNSKNDNKNSNNLSNINNQNNNNDTNPLSNINNQNDTNQDTNDISNINPNNTVNENKEAFEFLSNNKLDNQNSNNINEQNMQLENQNKENNINNSNINNDDNNQNSNSSLNNNENRSVTNTNDVIKNEELPNNNVEKMTSLNSDNKGIDSFDGKESLNNQMKDFDISNSSKNSNELKENFNNFNINDKSLSNFENKNQNKDLSNLNEQKEIKNFKEPNTQLKQKENQVLHKPNSIKEKYNSGKDFGKSFSKKIIDKKRLNKDERKNDK